MLLPDDIGDKATTNTKHRLLMGVSSAGGLL